MVDLFSIGLLVFAVTGWTRVCGRSPALPWFGGVALICVAWLLVVS